MTTNNTLPFRSLPGPSSLTDITQLLVRIDLSTKLSCVILSFINHSIEGLLRRQKHDFIQVSKCRPEDVWRRLDSERAQDKIVIARHVARGETCVKTRRVINERTRTLMKEFAEADSLFHSSCTPQDCIIFWRGIDMLFVELDRLVSHELMQNVAIRSPSAQQNLDYSKDEAVWNKMNIWFTKLDIDLPKIITSAAWVDLEFRNDEIHHRIKRLFARAKNNQASLHSATRKFVFDESSDESFKFCTNRRLYNFVMRVRNNVIMPVRHLFSNMLPADDVLVQASLIDMLLIHHRQFAGNFTLPDELMRVVDTIQAQRKGAIVDENKMARITSLVNLTFPQNSKLSGPLGAREINIGLLEQIFAVNHIFDFGPDTKCSDSEREFWRRALHIASMKLFERRIYALDKVVGEAGNFCCKDIENYFLNF